MDEILDLQWFQMGMNSTTEYRNRGTNSLYFWKRKWLQEPCKWLQEARQRCCPTPISWAKVRNLPSWICYQKEEFSQKFLAVEGALMWSWRPALEIWLHGSAVCPGWAMQSLHTLASSFVRWGEGSQLWAPPRASGGWAEAAGEEALHLGKGKGSLGRRGILSLPPFSFLPAFSRNMVLSAKGFERSWWGIHSPGRKAEYFPGGNH